MPRPRGRKGRYFRPEEVISALRAKGGIISAAAEALGCDVHTIRDHIKRRRQVAEAFEEVSERNLDLAEGIILRGILNGDEGCAKFYLQQRGGKRGWGNKVDLQAHVVADVRRVVRHDFRIDAPEDIAFVLRELLSAGALPPALGPGPGNGAAAASNGEAEEEEIPH